MLKLYPNTGCRNVMVVIYAMKIDVHPINRILLSGTSCTKVNFGKRDNYIMDADAT